ncbi:hypothetical protein WIV_gp134 [Wiseana iridescent virus]|uniref:Uncharacterized protein n=1 Tax=Wiseana iridescent virus TaxID=68347 RepID=G0T5G0_IRV9|nr:hypothetical protein WIV_gp134 [Wiseana iridescent virus]ADO00478.1 hypothetical protein [Wiseana iridescent virus]
MKYKDFYYHLNVTLSKTNATIGPSISIKLGENPKITMVKEDTSFAHRFVIFPIKIYGESLRHLNVLILDQKTKIIERYEPFNHHLNFCQINDLLESLLYQLMSKKKIYFLKYQTTLNTETVLVSKNCGLYCIKYISEKIKGA